MFRDRSEAGRLLSKQLKGYQDRQDTLVLGLARGGVVVAFEVANELHLPLNVIVPRKIGAPDNPELAIGSIMENGEGIFNHYIIQALRVPQSYITQEIAKEKAKAQQRLALYRQQTPAPQIQDHIVILVDDGIATGATMLTAIKAMRSEKAKKVIVAAPVASEDTLKLIQEAADEVICLYSSEDFIGVGMYYNHFSQTTDEEVVQLLKNTKVRT